MKRKDKITLTFSIFLKLKSFAYIFDSLASYQLSNKNPCVDSIAIYTPLIPAQYQNQLMTKL